MFKTKSKEPNLSRKGLLIFVPVFPILFIGMILGDNPTGFVIIISGMTLIGVIIGLFLRKANPIFGDSLFEKTVNNEATE